MMAVTDVFVLHFRLYGQIEEDWKAVGASNRKKDIARLGVKFFETYKHESDNPDMRPQDVEHTLQTMSPGSTMQANYCDGFGIELAITKIKVKPYF